MTTAPLQPRTETPHWLDPSLYPFEGSYFATPDGRLHVVDVGSGPPLVLVHGTPTWSFLYRHLITALSTRFRVIAVDHLGFGLSDKPAIAPYRPVDHARRVSALLDSLGLTDATLVVHDFGGPIGLSVALERPKRIARLVLFNTWMWSLDGDASIARGARLLSGSLGRFLYRHLNFPVKVLMPKAMSHARALTPAIREHYAAPLGSPDERMAAWACARALLGESDWYAALWERRDALRELPMLLLWGMKDPTFGPPYLAQWRRAFPNADVVTIASSGHFVPEESPAEALRAMEQFLERGPRDIG